MKISNHQKSHICILLMFIIIFSYNNKYPLKPLSWNVLCIIFIIRTLVNIYQTYKKENTK